jgi:hypothetical protein
MLRDFKIVKLALVTTNKNKKQQNPAVVAVMVALLVSAPSVSTMTCRQVVSMLSSCVRYAVSSELTTSYACQCLEHPTPIYSYCLWSYMHHPHT